MEEFAAFAAEVTADEKERLVEGNRAKVVDFHVAGHSDDIEGAVELAHGFVEKGGDDAAMDVAGRSLVEAVEYEMGRGDGCLRIRGVAGEDEVEALWVGRTAAEAVACALVDSRVSVHGGGDVSCVVG